MTKWIVGLLVLANLLLWSWGHWGGELTVDTTAAQAELHPDKIKLLGMLPASAPAAAQPLVSGMTLTLSPVAASAVPALSHSAPVVAHSAAAVGTSAKARSCAEWGEFSGSDLARAQQALAAFSLGDRLMQRTVEQNHGYWVYIPPLKKRSLVERKVAQLKERGVADYFVVQEEGKWQNAISLGVFKTEEAAQKYLTVLRNKDVRTAKVGERSSKLKFVVFVMKNLEAATLDKLNALQKDFPDSELKASACSN